MQLENHDNLQFDAIFQHSGAIILSV